MNNSKTEMQSEIIEIVEETDTNIEGSWKPREGETTLGLKKQVLASDIREHEWENIKEEAISVLSKCVPPDAPPKQETGLVVGYVQSGKTQSFTTVAALARDNGCQMIIVITGTSLNLRDQSTQRLEKDLDLHTLSHRKWHHFKSSAFNQSDRNNIKNVLASWQDPTVPQWQRQTVLITVMKHHQHLKNLIDILSGLDLSEVPTLVIDDEGDQASLNTLVQKGEASTTYQRILSLRECLPHHTFLQYTATPQAPLLINLIDVLSPNFVKVLTPGAEYTGGKAFFHDGDGLNRICTIPGSDIPTKEFPLDAPPESLLEAMRLFFLGVTAALVLEGENLKGNRSMMIHPSRETFLHEQYVFWIEEVKNYWLELLAFDGEDPDRLDLLEEFRNSYKDLQDTVPDLPSFEMLLPSLLHAIRQTQPKEFNATKGRTPPIVWENAYSYILVGGQAMDRGFTFRGLTVAYMPRGRGVGNADTIQQRARFFGYKKDIFGYCRVFLEAGVLDAYRHYITHEEDVRERLIAHSKTGKPLDEWKRAFFLDKTLKPTRQNVLDIGYFRVNSRGQWYDLKAPHDSSEANRVIVQEFLKNLSFQNDKGHQDRTDIEIHQEAEVSLKKVCEDLLLKFRITRLVDTQKFTGLHLQIAHYLDSHPDALCTVFHMSGGKLRSRRLHDDRNEIVRLFQGSNRKYPGDKSRKTSTRVTVQIHRLNLKRKNGDTFSDVPTLAVWLPKDLSPDSVVQNQHGT